MTKPTIFLSYSRKDGEWRDRISGHLKVLEDMGVKTIWSDEMIAPGEDWLDAIQRAMDQARVAILVISNDFLISPFIRSNEVPHLLKRRQTEGLIVIPVIARPCDWQGIDWLARIQCYPRDGRALAKGLSEGGEARVDEDLAGLARIVRELLGSSESSEVGASPLHLPELLWRPDRSPSGALLRAEYGVVPFHFRRDEIQDLEAWCRSGDSLAIRLYTGAGGMGKTRLALEIGRRLRAEGWQAGLVDHQRTAEETWRELVEIGGPRLLIIDYAETRRPLLVPLLREIYGAEDDAPIRVLLLARARLDWWDQLKAERDGVGELLSGPATRWHTLQPLALSIEERAESYEIALKAFADRLGQDLPQEMPEDLDAEHYERALLLHMSALAAVDGVEVKGEDGILDYVLDRERRFWKQHAVERNLAPEVVTGIGRAMAAITLGGGVGDEEKAVLAMRELKFFHDQKESVLTAVAHLLREIYPGENRWIEPVMPDLLGEHLIMREMEKDTDELLNLVLGGCESV